MRSGLTYTLVDDHSERPHWHSRYPWIEDPSTLPNNRKAVESTFLRTERQLAKELEWKAAYATQVHDMVNCQATMNLSKEALLTWSEPVWYISHLISPNPHSVTTPVRLVWNSSQKFRGLNLNDLLLKGPDVLHSIRSVLLKFRRGVFTALPFGLKTEKFICTGSWGGTMKNSWASMQSRESTLETSQQVVLLSLL